MSLTLPLAKAALLMVLFLVPGYLIRKFKVADENVAHVLSQLLVYVATPAMLFGAFIRVYDASSMNDFLLVLALITAFLLISYFGSDYMFPCSIPEGRRKVLRFGTTFQNAGNLGTPLILYTLGKDYVFYVQAAMLVFNFLAFTLGRYLYTGDKKHLSPKEAIFNPGLLPTLSGFIFYVTGLGGWMVNHSASGGALGMLLSLIISMLDGLANMVAPLTMIIIGIRLADLDLKEILTEGWMYLMLFYRLLLIPAVLGVCLLVLSRTGILPADVCAVVLIIYSTPCAALTTVFAELYDCDSVYASKLVAVSTLVSVFTMPIIISILG